MRWTKVIVCVNTEIFIPEKAGLNAQRTQSVSRKVVTYKMIIVRMGSPERAICSRAHLHSK